MTKPSTYKTRIAAVFLLLFGLVFATIGGGYTYFSYKFVQTAVSANGIVTDIQVTWSSDSNSGTSSPSYQPTIAFIDNNGSEQRSQTFLTSGNYNYPIGTKLLILYNPEDPSRMRIDNWLAVWGFGLLFLVTGTAVLLGAALTYARGNQASVRHSTTVADAAPPLATTQEADNSYNSSKLGKERMPTIRRK